MPITPLSTVFMANDKYRATLRSTWIASPADTSLLVTAVPSNVPTYVVVGWGTDYETLFSVTGKSGSDSATYALTGVTRIKGADENLPENTAVNCLNNEEFFNQYEDILSTMVTEVNAALEVVDAIDTVVNGDLATVADAATMDFDMADGANRKFKCSPTAARTFTLSNALVGAYFSIRITQPGTAYDMTWFTGFTITWQGATGDTTDEIIATKTGTYVFLVTGASTLDGWLTGVSV